MLVPVLQAQQFNTQPLMQCYSAQWVSNQGTGVPGTVWRPLEYKMFIQPFDSLPSTLLVPRGFLR